MHPLSLRNRYLLTPTNSVLGSRLRPALVFAPMAGGPLVAFLGGLIGSLLEIPILIAVCSLLGAAGFFGSVVLAWVFLLAASRDLDTATQMWLAGDNTHPIPLCQRSLARVFRADVRMRAFYTLALCAESNGDFMEADDLFRRAFHAVPAMAAQRWKRRAQCMMLAHIAIACVATGRIDDADVAVRTASALFPPLPPGALDALTDDAAFGAVGVSAALRDLEIGRDHRALLSLASVVVLAARGYGREALELTERERYFLMAGLTPREKALLANVEDRGRHLLGGGPMRSPGAVAAPQFDPASSAWATRILPPDPRG